MQCQNNLKQLGLGRAELREPVGMFPPSASRGRLRPATGWELPASTQRPASRTGCILVLPFLEQQPLYDKFDHTKPITDASERGCRARRRCP